VTPLTHQPPLDPPRRLGRLGGYLVFLLASVVVLITGLRLDCVEWRMPFSYDGDALLILPLVKATLERGSHWRNERLGAPGIQELHDFPIVDHLHFAALWLMGQVWPDPFAVYNLYYLLTYPLTVLTTMAVLRHFGLSIPAAGTGGLLYAFLPYHYLRGVGHYFLSAYFVVPLTLLVALWLCRGRLPFFTKDAEGRYRFKPWSADALVAFVIGVLTASAGAYYAFFGCALLVVAGCYGWVVTRNWRAAASMLLVVAVVVAAGVANHAPAFVYQYRNGPNTAPTERQPEEAEAYGMKLTQLFLPVSGHHSRALAAVRSAYDSETRPLQNENRTATLGLLGAIGLAVLLAIAVLPVRRRWPLGPLSALAVFAVLLGTIGGLGAIYNQLVSPQVRAYNRVSVYIAFLAFFAVCWLVDRFFDTRTGRARRLRWPALTLLAAFGIWDQTDDRWFRPDMIAVRADAAQRFRIDASFFANVERAMPNGMIFTLPYIAYPETFWNHGVAGYDQVRGYLHTKTLRWSFGTMKGREVDQWQREVATAPVPEMLRRLVLRDFDGLFVDRRGYDVDQADRLLAEIVKVLGTTPQFAHPDGVQVVFDLRPYRAQLREELGEEYEAARRREADKVSILWLRGFYSFEPIGSEWKHRWCGPTGVAVFINPTDRLHTLRLSMILRTEYEDYADLRIAGGDVWSERLPINCHCPPTMRTVVVPPGRHVVRFRCRMPELYLPRESRRLTFFVAQFHATDLDAEDDESASRR
jgi:hypothetical protein